MFAGGMAVVDEGDGSEAVTVDVAVENPVAVQGGVIGGRKAFNGEGPGEKEIGIGKPCPGFILFGVLGPEGAFEGFADFSFLLQIKGREVKSGVLKAEAACRGGHYQVNPAAVEVLNGEVDCIAL